MRAALRRAALDRVRRRTRHRRPPHPLYHLDRCWTEHLAFLADVREGIHLRALGRETPVDEFHRIAIAEFSQFFTRAYQRCGDTFTQASITADGVDLESLGLKRPTSTWTYMVTDNPFGTPEERFLKFVGTIIRDSAIKIGIRD
jgi:preprotein translocase subunit SecA